MLRTSETRHQFPPKKILIFSGSPLPIKRVRQNSRSGATTGPGGAEARGNAPYLTFYPLYNRHYYGGLGLFSVSGPKVMAPAAPLGRPMEFAVRGYAMQKLPMSFEPNLGQADHA